MRKNGFAITGIIYAMFLLFIVILVGNLSVELMMLKNNDNTNNRAAKTVKRVYKENGINVPILEATGIGTGTGLVPITRNEADTAWVVADQSMAWYDYSNKKWANAVVIKPTGGTKSPTQYLSSPGIVINEDDVLAYFVWIPRFSYAIPGYDELDVAYSTSSPVSREIAIILQPDTTPFGTNVTSPTDYKLSKLYQNTTDASYWISHPAFNYNGENISGFWVAKFETAYATATSKLTAEVANPDVANVVIKPNKYALRKASNMKTYFTLLNALSTQYEINGETRLLKNSEWGAVAYLAYSKYGKGSKLCNNDSTDYLTGRSSGTTSDTYTPSAAGGYQYDTAGGICASTTGNIYGVYDMAGGAADYVGGVMLDTTNTAIYYSDTGFSAADLPLNSKYVNQYAYGTDNLDWSVRANCGANCSSSLGLAMVEMCTTCPNPTSATWDGDQAGGLATTTNRTWQLRGNSSANTIASQGIFAFNAWTTVSYANATVRAAFIP